MSSLDNNNKFRGSAAVAQLTVGTFSLHNHYFMGREKRKYADRAAYMVKAVDKRRKLIRKMSVDYKGGRCEICGYSKCNNALEFHHRDSNAKDFGISAKGYTRSWEKVKAELNKCILLCANCHREIHDGVTQLP